MLWEASRQTWTSTDRHVSRQLVGAYGVLGAVLIASYILTHLPYEAGAVVIIAILQKKLRNVEIM